MAARILRYVASLYGSLLLGRKGAGRRRRRLAAPRGRTALSPVIPIVLYGGKAAWNAPRRLEDLIGCPGVRVPSYVRLRYVLLDVNRLEAKALRELRNALSGALLCEKGRLTGNRRLARDAIECVVNERDKELMEASWDFLYNAPGGSAALRRGLRAASLLGRDKTMTWTLYDLLEKEPRERGLKEGRQEGRQEGRRQERAESLEGVLDLIRKELRRLGIAERRYVKDLRNLGTARKAAALLLALGRAKNPAAYLRRRFGH